MGTQHDGTLSINELDWVRLQLLAAKRQIVELKQRDLVMQFIQANPDSQTCVIEIQRLLSEQKELVDSIYRESGIDNTEYDINLKTGKFDKRG